MRSKRITGFVHMTLERNRVHHILPHTCYGLLKLQNLFHIWLERVIHPIIKETTMVIVMEYGDDGAAVVFDGQECILSDEAKQMLASIHLGHREGWTFSSVKIPEEWCEVDALGALVEFEKTDLMQGLCAEISLRRTHLYSERNFHVASVSDRINIFETRLKVTLLVVKDPLRLSHLDDLNKFIEAYEDDFIGKGDIFEERYRSVLFERARFEGVPDEIILKIEEDRGHDLLECLHERNSYWKYVVEENFHAPNWCSTLLWPFVDENPFNLNNPSISRETAMTRADEIRKMIE